MTGGDLRMLRLEGHANHSAHLLNVIHRLLAEAGLSVANLDAVAFGAGPGAFTGVRLGCGVAQGLALGADLGVIPVTSLAALAATVSHPQVLAVTDARMGEVYHARYVVEGGRVTELSPPVCCAPGDVALPQGPAFGLGSAFAAYVDVLGPLVARLDGFEPAAVPEADAVARLAALVGRQGWLAPELAQPLYVRNKVALTTAERLAQRMKA